MFKLCNLCQRPFKASRGSYSFCSVKCRFWSKVEKPTPGGCRNWLSARRGSYGIFKYKGQYISAHRFVWFLTYGSIPNNRCILHKCDNPLCVNPTHLFSGTKADNAIDMAKKGRQRSHMPQKLTEEQVKAIKIELSEGTIHRIIAKKHGVTRRTIGKINSGIRWSHVIAPMLQYNMFS